MKGRPTKGYRRSAKIAALEAEYDLTFPEIIAGFAGDGLNRSQVAGVLEFDRATFYRKLKGLEAAGITFAWPDPIASRDRPPQERTPARVAATQANWAKFRANNAAYWDAHRRGTHEVAAQAHSLRLQGLSWGKIAARLQIDIGTLRRARARYKVPDPLGNQLKRAAQRQFSGSNREGHLA